MGLHARSVALAAGATGDHVERIAAMIVEARDITLEAARKALAILVAEGGAALPGVASGAPAAGADVTPSGGVATAIAE